MRIIKNLWTMAACCVFFLTACQQDEFRSATSGHVPVRFAPERATAGLTRVTGDDWENGNKIGIYMIPATSTTSTDGETKTEENEQEDNVFTKYAPDAYNIPYVFAVDGTNITLQAAAERKPIYYPVSGESVGFVAYYPYDPDVTKDNSVYKVNVQNQSKPKAIDLLYAKTTTGYNKENPNPVTLDFKHQLSRLNLTVKAAEGITMNLENVTLTGFPTTANFDLKTGELTDAAVGDQGIELEVKMNAENEKMLTLILIPHNNDQRTYERKINFTIAGMVYTYEFEEEFSLTAGSSRACTLTFTGTKVQLTQESIQLNYKMNESETIEILSSAELSIKPSCAQDEIIDDIGWFDCTLEQKDSDPITWYTYELTATSTKFNIANDDSSPRVGYIHLMEGDVSRRVIEVTQKSAEFFVDDLPTSLPAIGSGETKTLKIKTNSQDGEIQVTHEPTDIITNVQTSHGDMDATGVTEWSIDVTINTNESYRLGRNASFDVTINGEIQTVEVDQSPISVTEQPDTYVPDGMTNCYVVEKGESVTFSVLRAYSDAESSELRVDGSSYDGEFTLATVWDSGGVVNLPASTVKYKGSHAGITIQTNNEGNAVIALKRKAPEEIVWSYHIWVGTYNEVGGWMDRNIGGATDNAGVPTKAGNVYQWGRKDPFPSAFTSEENNAITYWISNSSTDATTATSVKLPGTVLRDTWRGASTTTSWDTGGIKTVHDPCPPGYKVPTIDDFNSLMRNWSQLNYTDQSILSKVGGYWSNGTIRNIITITEVQNNEPIWWYGLGGGPASRAYRIPEQGAPILLSQPTYEAHAVRCIAEYPAPLGLASLQFPSLRH